MAIELKSGEPVLFIQIRAMGDMILTTPVIREFKKRFPNNPIDVLAQPLPAQVLLNNPNVRNVYTDLKVAPLREQRYGLAIDFLSTPGSALISRLSGARYRIGYQLRWRSMWYTHPIERRVEPLYNPLTKFDLMNPLGVVPSDSALPEIFIRGKDKLWASNRLAECDLNETEQVIGLAPWSKREWRRWSLSSWIDQLKRINNEHKTSFIMFASESERIELKPLLDCRFHDNNKPIIWAGADHILRVAALMKRCQVLIGADNGLKHIAVAANVPTITVYVGSEPEVWNPPDDPKHIAIDVRKDPFNQIYIDQIINKQRETAS